jgi:hypothetical protein
LEDDFNLIIYCYEQSNPTNRIFHKKLNLEETKDFFSNIFKFKNIETGFNLKLDEIKTILNSIEITSDNFKLIFDRISSKEELKKIVKNLTLEQIDNLNSIIMQTKYKQELENLKKLIELENKHINKELNFRNKVHSDDKLKKYLSTSKNGQIEGTFENWIKENLWILDSEFDIDLKRKEITKKIKGGKRSLVDLVLKTKDNFLNLIEVKRPKEKLFNWDKGHKNSYQHCELSKAIHQCIKYLEVIERPENKDLLEKEEQVFVLRPKIKLIYGHYSNDLIIKKQEIERLRSLNFHTNCIEVITYDDLIFMGERIINFYEVK